MLPEEEVEKRVNHALKKIHIEHLRDKQIYKMSGGEKKMASIATILAMTPDIILMDEPSIALDPRNRRSLIHILNDFEHLKIISIADNAPAGHQNHATARFQNHVEIVRCDDFQMFKIVQNVDQ